MQKVSDSNTGQIALVAGAALLPTLVGALAGKYFRGNYSAFLKPAALISLASAAAAGTWVWTNRSSTEPTEQKPQAVTPQQDSVLVEQDEDVDEFDLLPWNSGTMVIKGEGGDREITGFEERPKLERTVSFRAVSEPQVQEPEPVNEMPDVSEPLRTWISGRNHYVSTAISVDQLQSGTVSADETKGRARALECVRETVGEARAQEVAQQMKMFVQLVMRGEKSKSFYRIYPFMNDQRGLFTNTMNEKYQSKMPDGLQSDRWATVLFENASRMPPIGKGNQWLIQRDGVRNAFVKDALRPLLAEVNGQLENGTPLLSEADLFLALDELLCRPCDTLLSQIRDMVRKEKLLDENQTDLMLLEARNTHFGLNEAQIDASVMLLSRDSLAPISPQAPLIVLRSGQRHVFQPDCEATHNVAGKAPFQNKGKPINWKLARKNVVVAGPAQYADQAPQGVTYIVNE